MEPFSWETFDNPRATRELNPVTLAEWPARAADQRERTVGEACIRHVLRGQSRSQAAECPVDRLLAELGRRQHGVVARAQLLERGVSRRAVEVRLQRGSLHPLHRGVYAVGHGKLTMRGKWMGAVLAGGPGAALSHRSAAALWRIRPRGSEIEITRPKKFRGRPGIAAHCSALPADEVTMIDGVPVTTVPRTIFDLASMATMRQVERAFNEAEVRQLRDSLSIPDLLERYPGRRGAAVLRAIVGDEAKFSGVTRNDFEERFAHLVDAHGLPRPRFNADIAVRGRFFEADALWTGAKLIVELDGRAAHGTKRAFETDRERDRLLQADGWRVVRVTWRQLRDGEAAIAADLRAILGSTLWA